MLDGPGDAGRDVEPRPDGGAGLADLVGALDQARVDRRARGADLAAEQVGQLAQQGEFVGAASTPAPPATMTGASLRLTVRLADLAAQDLEGEVARLERRGRPSRSTPVRDASAAGLRMTPSRTVAICGRVFGLTIVAIRLPPKAGRIW